MTRLAIPPAVPPRVATRKHDVGTYYDQTQFLYNIFWIGSSLHYGFWEPGTTTLEEATRNTNRFVAEHLGVSPGDRVLDAGCGPGGTSHYLAANHGADVVGITLSRRQLRTAIRTGRQSAPRPRFLIRDFADTGLRGGSFQSVVAIESVCHAPSKVDFIREAFRLLAPGGKLAVVDAFLREPTLSPPDDRYYREVLDGWRLGPLLSVDEFTRALYAAGFATVECHDKSKAIVRSSRRMYAWGKLMYPLIWMLTALRLAPDSIHGHAIAVLRQKLLFESGASTYRAFIATKPK